MMLHCREVPACLSRPKGRAGELHFWGVGIVSTAFRVRPQPQITVKSVDLTPVLFAFMDDPSPAR